MPGIYRHCLQNCCFAKFAHNELLIQLSAAGMIFFWMKSQGTDTVGALEGWGGVMQ